MHALKCLEHRGGSVESTDPGSSALSEIDTSSETTDHNPPSKLDELPSAGPGDSVCFIGPCSREKRKVFWKKLNQKFSS